MNSLRTKEWTIRCDVDHICQRNPGAPVSGSSLAHTRCVEQQFEPRGYTTLSGVWITKEFEPHTIGGQVPFSANDGKYKFGSQDPWAQVYLYRYHIPHANVRSASGKDRTRGPYIAILRRWMSIQRFSRLYWISQRCSRSATVWTSWFRLTAFGLP